MVGRSGKSSNYLLDILTEWNAYLQENCTDVYAGTNIEPEP
jgi:hypothetical protein